MAPKTCPGVPAGPPPLVADYDEEDESLDSDVSARGKKIRFAPEDNQNSKNNQKVKEFFGKRPILVKNTPLSVLRLTISYVLHNIYHIQEFSSEDQGNVDSSKNKADTPKVDSLQKRMLAMSGQDVDAYMKEMEEVHRQTQAEKERELQSR